MSAALSAPARAGSPARTGRHRKPLPRALAIAVIAGALADPAGPAPAQPETVEEIATRGQAMRFLLIRPAGGQPAGSVILVAGGHGDLALGADGRIGWGKGNQLVRTRAAYAEAGYATAVPDIAPDLKPGNAPFAGYRWSAAHAADIGALVRHLRTVAEPVYLIGTSRGAISVANAAARLSGGAAPDAIVLTSGMLMHVDVLRPSAERSVGRLERIGQPVLIVYHRLDQCRYTPPSSAEAFRRLLTGARKVDIRMLEGGSAVGEPCAAQHYHGFRGLDAEVVRITTEWLRALR